MKKITFDELNEWAVDAGTFMEENACFHYADHFEDEGAQFHPESLAAERVEIAPCLVIDGDLHVRGFDMAFDVGLLVVKGDLHCDGLFDLSCDVVVQGGLFARHIYLCSGNDNMLIVGGDIRAESLVEYGHYTKAQGRIVAAMVVSLMNDISADGGIEGVFKNRPQHGELPAIFIDAVLDGEGYFNEGAYKNALATGVSPFRDEIDV